MTELRKAAEWFELLEGVKREQKPGALVTAEFLAAVVALLDEAMKDAIDYEGFEDVEGEKINDMLDGS